MNFKSRVNRLLKDQPLKLVDVRSKSLAYDVVNGAGGVKGYAEIGALQALIDLKVPVRIVRGVSIGAANAALTTNGFSPKRQFELYESERARMYDAAAAQYLYKDLIASLMYTLSGRPEALKDWTELVLRMQRQYMETIDFWQQSLTVPTAPQFMHSRSIVSLHKLWKRIVVREKLVPNDNLEIVAYRLIAGKPIYFKGTDYPLATAIAGSGSLPGVFAPVPYKDDLLGDGAIAHYNPVNDLREPAIVIRLGRATKVPSEPLTLVDASFHFLEMHMPLMPTDQSVDESKHVVIHIPCDDIAGLSFGVSERRRLELVEEGYDVTYADGSKAIGDGRIIIPGA